MTCITCKIDKPITSFKERIGSDKRHGLHRNSCKQCMSSYLKAWKLANPDKVRSYSPLIAKWEQENKPRKRLTEKLRRHKITPEQYNLLFEQYDCCFICGKRNEVGRTLNIDHCHKTNIIRGLLCGACNRGLGLFKDNPESLVKAIDYLKNNLSLRKAG